MEEDHEGTKKGTKQQMRWRSVEDELPKARAPVVGTNAVGWLGIVRVSKDGQWAMHEGVPWHVRITHWMPLPDPPQAGGEGHG